jgi:hypothetical protein
VKEIYGVEVIATVNNHKKHMIGGKVVETIVDGDRVWINCQEFRGGETYNTFCAIYVKSTAQARSVSEGDIIWWQGDRAMWTAKNSYGKTIGKPDTILKRIGYSGAKKPTKRITIRS